MTRRSRNKPKPQRAQNSASGGQRPRQTSQPTLGVHDATIPKAGTVQTIGVGIGNFPSLKGLLTGKHEYRLTSGSISITVATRQGNDGELVARLLPKNWTASDTTQMKTEGAAYRYISSSVWGTNLVSAGDWVNVSNEAAFAQIGGYALEKDTKISILLRGTLQTR